MLEEALDNNLITQTEFSHMIPDGKSVAKFYMTFKVHKEHNDKETPPPRPIISGSGSITEQMSLYVEHHIKNFFHTTYSIFTRYPPLFENN